MIGILFRLILVLCIPLSLFCGFWGGILTIASLGIGPGPLGVVAFGLGAIITAGITYLLSVAVVNFVFVGVPND